MNSVGLPSHSAILCLTQHHSSLGEFYSNYLLNALAFLVLCPGPAAPIRQACAPASSQGCT